MGQNLRGMTLPEAMIVRLERPPGIRGSSASRCAGNGWLPWRRSTAWLSLLLIVHTFVHPLPVVEAGDRWFARVRKRLARLVRCLPAWTMTGLCVFALYVTFKGVMIITRA